MDVKSMLERAAAELKSEFAETFKPISFETKFTPIRTEPHSIELSPDAERMAFPRRRNWSGKDRQLITSYFEDRLRNGMWREVTEKETPQLKWISYPFCVSRNGKDRVVFNFAPTVNRYTLPDPYRMPNAQEIRNSTSGSKLFSVLDMQESFSQFPLAEDSQLYFATELPDGRLVVPTVILMGPTNSPAAV